MKRIEVVVTERKTTDGRAFNVYHTYSKNGRKTELKFRKEVTNLPTKHCYANVPITAMNLNTAGRFPVLWVSQVESYEDFDAVNAENQRAKINDYFGE